MQGDDMAMTGAAALAGNSAGAFSAKALFAAIPTPVLLVATVGIGWPGALPTLREFSETFANIAAIVIPSLALIKILWPAANVSQHGFAKAGGVFSALANATGRVAGAAALILSAFALFSWLTAGKSQAAPVPAGIARRKPTDDAGDDGEELPGTILDNDPQWLRTAKSLRGTDEAIGSRSNPKVVAMFAEVGHPEIRNARTTPWCAAFVGACLERAGIPSTKSLMARSYLKWGDRLETPRPGCVTVIWRGSRNDGETGHVFFFTRREGNYVYGVGGNQGDSVSEARFPASRVLGYRWPRKAVQLKTAQAGAGAALTASSSAGLNTAAEVMDAQAQTAPPSASAVVVESAEKLQDPLRELATWCRWAGIALAVLTVALASYAVYRRVSDYRARGV